MIDCINQSIALKFSPKRGSMLKDGKQRDNFKDLLQDKEKGMRPIFSPQQRKRAWDMKTEKHTQARVSFSPDIHRKDECQVQSFQPLLVEKSNLNMQEMLNCMNLISCKN